jgi:hypothetical protein
MFRIVPVAFALFCLTSSAGALAPSAPRMTAPSKLAIQRPSTNSQALTRSPRPLESGHCQLGVIPIVGIVFHVQKIGFMVFGNEDHRVRVDDWAFDDLVAARVRAAARGQTVRRIRFAREELARHAHKGAPFRNFDAELKDFIRYVAAGSNCDRYVVVHLSSSRVFDSYDRADGMGIINVPSPIQRRTYLFALTYIRIYDGHSFDILKEGAASLGDEPRITFTLGTTPFRGPKREIAEDAFPARPADAAANRDFRDGARALLKASLDKTLPALLAPPRGK